MKYSYPLEGPHSSSIFEPTIINEKCDEKAEKITWQGISVCAISSVQCYRMGIKLPLRSSSGYQPQWYHSSLWSKDSSKCKGSPNKKYEGAILSMTYLTCEGCLASNRYAPGRTLFVNGVLKYNTYNTNVDIMAIFIKVFHLWKSAEFQIRTQYAKWLKGSYNRRAYDLICLLKTINDLQYNHLADV